MKNVFSYIPYCWSEGMWWTLATGRVIMTCTDRQKKTTTQTVHSDWPSLLCCHWLPCALIAWLVRVCIWSIKRPTSCCFSKRTKSWRVITAVWWIYLRTVKRWIFWLKINLWLSVVDCQIIAFLFTRSKVILHFRTFFISNSYLTILLGKQKDTKREFSFWSFVWLFLSNRGSRLIYYYIHICV